MKFHDAMKIVELSLEIARQKGFPAMCGVVVDPAGDIICSGRDEGANFLRFKIAYGKAVAAAGMGINSRQLLKKATEMPLFFNSIASSMDKPFIPQTGAIVLIRNNVIIGAIGLSGGTGDQDEVVAIEAAQTLKLDWK